MNAGGFAAIAMTLFLRLTAPRPSRIETEFALSELPKIREFLGAFVSRSGWDTAMANRLDAVAEEAMLTFGPTDESGGGKDRRRLLLVAHKEKDSAVLEFIVALLAPLAACPGVAQLVTWCDDDTVTCCYR